MGLLIFAAVVAAAKKPKGVNPATSAHPFLAFVFLLPVSAALR
jgi:hypothetical protein